MMIYQIEREFSKKNGRIFMNKTLFLKILISGPKCALYSGKRKESRSIKT